MSQPSLSSLNRLHELVLILLSKSPSSIGRIQRTLQTSAEQNNSQWTYTIGAVNKAILKLRKLGYVEEDELASGTYKIFVITQDGINWLSVNQQFRKTLNAEAS